VSELALAAAGLAGLAVVRALAARRSDPVAFELSFPRGLTPEDALAAIRSLSGLLPPWWRRPFGVPTITLEAVGTADGIRHVLRVPSARAEFVVGALRAALPGLRVDTTGEVLPDFGVARELRFIGSGQLRTRAAGATNAGLLAALQPVRRDETAAIQYVIVPLSFGTSPGLRWLADAFLPGSRSDGHDSPAEPEFAVAVRAGVAAPSPERRRQLIARLLGPFHPVGTDEARLGRRALPSALVAQRVRAAAPPDHGACRLRADELAAMASIPLGGPQLPGLRFAGARELAAVASVPRRGLVLGRSTVNGAPVAVALEEAQRSIHLCAPTGAGKSTVLLNLACQLMTQAGLILIDSKGQLAADLLDRVPAEREDDVLVFDPADPKPLGFNLIGGMEEAELVVDHVVGQFRARYGAAGLGPRSEDILRSSLLTLAAGPEPYTLCEVEPLLTNAGFRQRLVGRLNEPVLESFWGWFGGLSEAARAEAVAPLANKLRSFTLRRRVRAVIGQSDGLDLARVLAERKILVVNLARGLVGEDAAALIGAAMTARLWAAIQGRAGVPAAERHPAVVICDEFQDFAAGTVSFGDAVAQSRGYGVGWVLAHQHLAQLDPPTRQAVLANCRSRLVMQTTAADAAAFSREFSPWLDAADLQGLGPFEGYAAVSTGAAVAPPASIRTAPAPAALGSAERVRARSRTRYGRAAADVDAAIRQRVVGRTPIAPVGGVRRGS
jgi:hypothetical protein